MKRVVRIVSLILVLSMLLAVGGAMAAASTVPVVFGVKMEKNVTAKLVSDTSAAVVNASGSVDGVSRDVYKNVGKIELSFKGTVGEQTVVFLVKGSESEAVVKPTEGSIYYIDQIVATGKDAVTIYPKNLTDAGHYRIYIADKNGYTLAGRLNVANSWEEYDYLLGDVNNDGKVDSLDAFQVLKHYAQIETLDEEALKRAEVNNDGKVDSTDSFRILKKYAKLLVSLEEG